MTHHTTVSSTQIRAARALLNWSQEDLAEAARLSIATVRKLELGFISPRISTTATLHETFEEAGIEFIASDGVRRRSNELKMFDDEEGVQSFLKDINRAIYQSEHDILIVGLTYNRGCLFGADIPDNLAYLLSNNPTANIKVLLTDTIDLCYSDPHVEFRVLSTKLIEPMPFCVYGNNYATISGLSGTSARIVVVHSAVTANHSRQLFFSMWEKATPFIVAASAWTPLLSKARAR